VQSPGPRPVYDRVVDGHARGEEPAEWASFVARARAEHPGIELDVEVFARHVRERLAPNLVSAAELARRHAGDLWLACACAAGDRGALACCMTMLRPDVERSVARSRGATIAVDDLAQRLWTRLFVAEPPRPARIADYHGGSPLRTWARVIIARMLVDEARHRGARPEQELPARASIVEAIAPLDPELALLEERWRDRIGAALREALAGLEPRERALLRHRIVDGLGTESIGVVFGVHRTTAARWIEAALARLHRDAHERLRTTAGISAQELASLVTLMRSRLEVSVGGLLSRA
jgi:RNA polymerase sigma-70 factor (ECF subfamily)